MATLTKRERQDAKLTLAGTDRIARNVIEPGRYIDVTADATQLPTRYAVGDNNTNNLVINPNISGLLPGRPWNSTVSVYAILALEPKLVFNFTGNVFKTGGVASTFSNSVTHARAGQATMVDSDGLIKWAPHNLFKNSQNYNLNGWYRNQYTVTPNNDIAPDGTTTANLVSATDVGVSYLMDDGTAFTDIGNYTIKFWAKANTGVSTLRIWFWLLGGSAGSSGQTTFNLTNEWQLLEINPTITTAGQPRIRIDQPGTGASSFYLWGAHAYRSNLGGMVNNPSQPTGFETYVPTSGSTVYAPRLGHHVYNGSAWVNEGILHESEARTNQMRSSGDANGTGWTGQATAGTVTAGSPFGTYQTISPVSSSANLGGAQRYQIGKPLTTGETYVGWALAKYSAGSGWFVVNIYDTSKANEQAYFDLQNGVVGSKQPLIIDHGMVDYGDGWWLCWASSNAASGSGGMSVEIPNGDGVQSCSATDVILVAGSQFEQGATPSSYIPTSGSNVTRAAETLTVPAANLPYPTPVVIGSELVTNGTFDSNTNDWTATTSTLSVDSNRLKVTNTGPFGQAIHTFPTVSGKTYLITADFIAGNAGNPDGYISVNEGQWGGVIYNGTSDGSSTDKSFSILFKATSHITKISLVNFFGSAGDFNLWDNVSVKEINPLALSIQMDGKMTYADGSSSYSTGHWTAGEATWFRWSAASTEFLYAGQATVASRTGQMIVGQRTLGTSFSSTISAFDYFKPDINVPFNIATRHSSTFLNGAADGTALTAATPAGMPDLSNSNLDLGFEFMGTIAQFRVWDEDLGDAGIAEATEPSTEPSLSLTFDGSENSFIVLDWSE
jgi:hypothetical protein